MELCGGACEDGGNQRRCWGDAAQTRSCVLRSEGRTGKGSGVGDGVGASRGGAVFDVGCDGRNTELSEARQTRSR